GVVLHERKKEVLKGEHEGAIAGRGARSRHGGSQRVLGCVGGGRDEALCDPDKLPSHAGVPCGRWRVAKEVGFHHVGGLQIPREEEHFELRSAKTDEEEDQKISC
ncbi:hypothetical protein BHM03_00061118, partial [Ensete ventricosum]